MRYQEWMDHIHDEYMAYMRERNAVSEAERKLAVRPLEVELIEAYLDGGASNPATLVAQCKRQLMLTVSDISYTMMPL